MTRQETLDAIDHFIHDEVSLEDVSEELDYRDNAAPDMRWDNNLLGYTTEELQEVEKLWEDLNKRKGEKKC